MALAGRAGLFSVLRPVVGSDSLPRAYSARPSTDEARVVLSAGVFLGLNGPVLRGERAEDREMECREG